MCRLVGIIIDNPHHNYYYSDINECELAGSCSQNCENFVGSFKCSCMPGYQQDLHNSSVCKVAKGKVGLLFTHQTDIRLTDVVGHETQELVDNTHSATFVVRFVEL